ncbi:MAG: glycosyltransferase family 2 protein, partial [Planctomycetota bacterium]
MPGNAKATETIAGGAGAGSGSRDRSCPLVSIGMPVHNGERHLEEALDSLLGQDYGHLELIISDNASSDATEEICRSRSARDPRVRYLRSERNLGAARNYNRVFELARGKYFKWAAHDDRCAPTFLSACVEALEGAPESVVLCYPRTTLIGDGGEEMGSYEDRLDLRQGASRQRLRAFLENFNLCNAIHGLIRADALQRTRRIDSFVSSDVVLLAELSILGEIWEVPRPLFERRVHPGSSRSKNSTADEVALWFDAGSRGAGPPMCRLGRGHDLPALRSGSAAGEFRAGFDAVARGRAGGGRDS